MNEEMGVLTCCPASLILKIYHRIVFLLRHQHLAAVVVIVQVAKPLMAAVVRVMVTAAVMAEVVERLVVAQLVGRMVARVDIILAELRGVVVVVGCRVRQEWGSGVVHDVEIAHQLLEGRVRLVQISLHGELGQCFPRGLVALDLHGVTLHADWRLVADRTGCHHGDTLKGSVQASSILKIGKKQVFEIETEKTKSQT